MRIEIEFDGSTARTLINGKPIHICCDIEYNFMFNAFECIRKDIERKRKQEVELKLVK